MLKMIWNIIVKLTIICNFRLHHSFSIMSSPSHTRHHDILDDSVWKTLKSISLCLEISTCNDKNQHYYRKALIIPSILSPIPRNYHFIIPNQCSLNVNEIQINFEQHFTEHIFLRVKITAFHIPLAHTIDIQ